MILVGGRRKCAPNRRNQAFFFARMLACALGSGMMEKSQPTPTQAASCVKFSRPPPTTLNPARGPIPATVVSSSGNRGPRPRDDPSNPNPAAPQSRFPATEDSIPRQAPSLRPPNSRVRRPFNRPGRARTSASPHREGVLGSLAIGASRIVRRLARAGIAAMSDINSKRSAQPRGIPRLPPHALAPARLLDPWFDARRSSGVAR